MQNYLARHVKAETEKKVARAEENLAGSTEVLERIKKAALHEQEAIEMQMAMLAYSTLDIFSEKSQIIPDRVKTAQDQKDRQAGKETSKEVENAYLGLLTQSFIDRYEIDVYGYVSITSFKYVVFKIEQRLNPVNAIPSEKHVRLIFEKVQSFHT